MANERIVALSNQLREEGVAVSIRSTQTACEVWEIMKKTNDMKNMKTALRSVYIKDPNDTMKFNRVFEKLFTLADKEEPFVDMPRERYDPTLDDPSFDREDIMGKPNAEESDLPIEQMVPPEFNPELLQQKKIHEKDILRTDINHINTFDERIFDLCRKLGKKIANQRARRRNKMKSNYINMPRTIRANLKNGGKLINLHKGKPHIKKTHHIFLSDISGSCDWISSWFFSIIYGCQKSFDKISTYEFDNKIINTQEALKSESYYESYENITLLRMQRGMLHGQSNMATAFEEFLDEAHLNHRTMVIILTDCRDWTGKREDGILESATILHEIVKKSSKVVILNPEGKEKWNTPTSCVHDYENAGAKVYEIGNLNNLANLITKL